MTRRLLIVFVPLLAAGICLVAPPAHAEKIAATAAIRSANSRVRELLVDNKGPERVTATLRGLFDISDLARRALVDQWEKMTPAQRTELVDTLRQIVERNYISQLRSNLDYEIVYSGEEPALQDGDVVVKTVIKAKRSGRPVEIPVDYVLRPEGGGWRAYDVITDDVSLLKNYRSQFNRIIAKEGVPGLLHRMKAKLEDHED